MCVKTLTERFDLLPFCFCFDSVILQPHVQRINDVKFLLVQTTWKEIGTLAVALTWSFYMLTSLHIHSLSLFDLFFFFFSMKAITIRKITQSVCTTDFRLSSPLGIMAQIKCHLDATRWAAIRYAWWKKNNIIFCNKILRFTYVVPCI